jgi:predicted CXXCH cytochrome family protein
MKTLWKPSRPAALSRWIRNLRQNVLWIAGGGASTALILISCGTTGHTMMAPPTIPGASFVGSSECSQCHEKVTKDFKTADHSRLQAKGENAKDMGCESCHGPGSKHVESGGATGTIVNPNKSPETCFKCHLDKKAEFMLPYAHQVLNGKMTCSDCHDPHKGSAMKSGGTQLEGRNETCFKCHTAQRGPFIIPHEAVREGCTSCHSPHGSTNQKMLTERNATLCLKCHFQDQSFGQAASATSIRIGSGAHGTAGNRLAQTCWSADCHEGIHGSNTDKHLRE